MNRKILVSAVVIAAAVGLAAWLRTDNRADAAAGNCYADTKGPSEPTLCN
jgi:hypothetical protein